MMNDGPLVRQAGLREVEVLTLVIDMDDWGVPNENDPGIDEVEGL